MPSNTIDRVCYNRTALQPHRYPIHIREVIEKCCVRRYTFTVEVVSSEIISARHYLHLKFCLHIYRQQEKERSINLPW